MKTRAPFLTITLSLMSISSLFASKYSPYRPNGPREARQVMLPFVRQIEAIGKRHGERHIRTTFERAEAGNIRALKAVFFNPAYFGGENEGYNIVPGNMCIAVGDRKITTFLKSLPLRDRRDLLDLMIRRFIPPDEDVLPFDGTPPYWPTPSEVSEAQRWLRRHFPRMIALNKATRHFDGGDPFRFGGAWLPCYHQFPGGVLGSAFHPGLTTRSSEQRLAVGTYVHLCQPLSLSLSPLLEGTASQVK